MAFVTLSLCELFRAYTVRSERYALARIGLFSNRFMFPAVATAVLLLLAVVYIPVLQPIFHTRALQAPQWLLIAGLSVIPAISEEITKTFLRRQPATA